MKRLAHHRLLLTRDDREDDTRLGISVKGCIALYAYNAVTSEMLAACASRVWGVRATPQRDNRTSLPCRRRGREG